MTLWKLQNLHSQLTIFRDDLAKITKYRKSAIFRDVLAKTAKFTIFMIFRQTLRQNCQNSSPFVMLITTHPQSGAADFTILTEIAKFANFTFFRQNLPRICHHFSPFFMWRKTHPRSDAAGMFYKLSKPCIKFGLQQEKHDMNTPGSSSQVQLRLTILIATKEYPKARVIYIHLFQLRLLQWRMMRSRRA